MRTNPPAKLTAGVLYTLAAAFGFAMSLVMARLSYSHGSDPASVMFVRFLAMSMLLLLWNRHKKQSLRLHGAPLRGSLLCGLLYFSAILAYLSSVAWLPVSLAVLIYYTFPLFVALISAVVLRRVPGPMAVFSLLLAFAGLLLALNVQTAELSGIGLALAGFAAMAMAANIVLSSHLLRDVPTSVFISYTSVVSVALASVVVLWGEGLQLPVGLFGWGVFLLMLLCFFIAFISTFKAIASLGSLRFASLMNLEPVATVFLALIVLSESLSGAQLMGAAIVIVAVVLSQYDGSRSTQLP